MSAPAVRDVSTNVHILQFGSTARATRQPEDQRVGFGATTALEHPVEHMGAVGDVHVPATLAGDLSGAIAGHPSVAGRPIAPTMPTGARPWDGKDDDRQQQDGRAHRCGLVRAPATCTPFGTACLMEVRTRLPQVTEMNDPESFVHMEHPTWVRSNPTCDTCCDTQGVTVRYRNGRGRGPPCPWRHSSKRVRKANTSN